MSRETPRSALAGSAQQNVNQVEDVKEVDGAVLIEIGRAQLVVCRRRSAAKDDVNGAQRVKEVVADLDEQGWDDVL